MAEVTQQIKDLSPISPPLILTEYLSGFLNDVNICFVNNYITFNADASKVSNNAASNATNNVSNATHNVSNTTTTNVSNATTTKSQESRRDAHRASHQDSSIQFPS